jgi:hypothetical protein
MHPFFENLVIIGASSLQASLMYIHHNTSFKSILENDSISSTSKAYIRYLFRQGGGAMVEC